MTPGSSPAAAALTGLAATVAVFMVGWLMIDAGGDGERAKEGQVHPVASASSSPPLPESFDVEAKPAAPAGSHVNDARPRMVRLPSGAEVPLRPAATSERGLLRVPGGIQTAAWWDGGARLGERYGGMVLAGHVDSTTQGLGPFAEMLSARRGQFVDVSAGGRRQRFSIVSVQVVTAEELRGRSHLFSQRGPLRLVLVTCAGPFIESKGGYQNRIIATAAPFGPLVDAG